MDETFKVIDWFLYNHRYIREFIEGRGEWHKGVEAFDMWVQAQCEIDRYEKHSEGCGGSPTEAWVIAKNHFIKLIDRFENLVVYRLKALSYKVYFLKYQLEDSDKDIWYDLNNPNGRLYEPSRKEVKAGTISCRVHLVREFGKKVLQDEFEVEELERFMEVFESFTKK